MKTLLIDNYDSYTFNLYQLLAEINGDEPLVVRNDECDWAELARLPVENIVISPGPGTAEKREDFGVCADVLREARIPVLGVCLGHQGLGAVYGARIAPAPVAMHGRLSPVYHNEDTLFTDLPQGFSAVRYHSLVVTEPLPPWLERIAWTTDGVVMGLRHTSRPLWGVQFHPESIATEHGQTLLTNFRDLTDRLTRQTRTADGALPWSAPQPTTTPSAQQSTYEETQRFLPRGPRLTPTSQRQQRSSSDLFVRRLPTLYDPEQVFLHCFAQEPYAYWLDSSDARPGAARFSFMGACTTPQDQVVTYDLASRRIAIHCGGQVTYQSGSILTYLEQELDAWSCSAPDLPFDFNGGFVGYFGYELKAECGAKDAHRAETPDAVWLYATRSLVFDHREKATYLLYVRQRGSSADMGTPRGQETCVEAGAWFDATERRLRHLPQIFNSLPARVAGPTRTSADPVEFRLRRPYASYIKDIRSCQRQILAGETYEVCLTNQITAALQLDPLTTYRNLRRLNPAPYAAYLRLGKLAILSSSPERFLRLDHTHQLEAKPIKGTAARMATPSEDDNARDALLQNEKERAEHLMIVDLLRNDLGRVCQIGSVSVPTLMAVESYQTVHQLVSTIRGQVRPELGAIDCVRAAFPGGSMTGAPKLRTMQILDTVEAAPRGVYAGALGYLSLNGTADLSMVIRTIVMVGERISIGVGGAIVAQSDPEREFDEIMLKARAPLAAIALTATGSDDGSQWRISNGRPER
ncbi:MAG TPA: aminodeoxychorismate synthase component I [Ktedonobacterales bacterium]|nr:aminodeoxychorismate synthase component I [Ktedonobacterales bacterium]